MSVMAAVLLATLVVATSSRAAFTTTTSNTGNSLTSGAAISLVDNDGGASMFAAVTDLLPGDSEVSCITVTYESTPDPDAVVLFMPAAPSGGTLADDLTLTIEMGADALPAFDDCTTFIPTGGPLFDGSVSDFATTHGDAASGLVTWDPDPALPLTTTATFRFTLTVDATADPSDTTAFDFTWQTDL
jgi:hypothetical protein